MQGGDEEENRKETRKEICRRGRRDRGKAVLGGAICESRVFENSKFPVLTCHVPTVCCCFDRGPRPGFCDNLCRL